MDVDSVIKKMAEILEKRTSDIKRSFNATRKKKAAELTDKSGECLVSDEELDSISLITVGKKYKLGRKNVEGLIYDAEGTTEEDDEDLEEDIDLIDTDDLDDDDYEDDYEDEDDDEEEEVVIAKKPRKKIPKKGKVDKDSWATLIANLPDPNEPKYKKKPSLIQQYGATYTISINDVSKPPFEYEGKYGLLYVFDITLHKVRPEDFYDDIFDKGEAKGKDMYVDGDEYSFWLPERAFGRLCEHFGGKPKEGVKFTYRKTRKGNNPVDYVIRAVKKRKR
jgi:hypothetical protein